MTKFHSITILTVLSCFLIISAAAVKADQQVAPQVQWRQTYNTGTSSVIRGMIHTLDKGYALFGTFMNIELGEDGSWLIKTDSWGNEQWNQTYVNFGTANSIVQTTDGGLVLLCLSDNGANLIKTDSRGQLQWNYSYSGSLNSLVQTEDNGYILAGNTASSTDDKFLLVKTDSLGSVQWNQSYGGQGSETAFSVVQSKDGGYVLAGGSSYGGYLVRTDSLGKMIWNYSLGYSLNSIIQAKDGEFVVAGSAKRTDGTFNLWIAKIDSSGAVSWDQTFDATEQNSNNELVTALSVIQTTDGGYAVVGNSGVLKIDSSGNLQWKITTKETEYSIVQDSDGSFVVAGGGEISGGWLFKTYATTSLGPTATSLPTSNPTSKSSVPTEVVYFSAILISVVLIAIIVFVITRKKR
jgi:hypothetical protein